MGPLRRVIAGALRRLDADLRVEVLTERAGMSPRNFTRRLQSTPARLVEAERLEQARSCLEGGAR